jgi:tetratricopeptide (TPR) repeat protein
MSSTKRFRVAFSFAGEKRDFVASVARMLADRFGEARILYDKFHKAEFSNANLAFDLPRLYHESTDLIVAVFCPDYPNKEWCGLEWRAIFDLIKKGRTKDVMLTRFGRVEGEGLYSLAGYTDLQYETPESTATTILERLAINEGNPRDHYTKPAPTTVSTPRISIPHNLPALQPFFGREQELKKIADALEPESRTWGALIDGPGGMGKTSLAVRAAYDASNVFDKIVFVSLKTRELDDDGVRDLSGFLISGLAELLNELARELGKVEIAKATEEARPRLLLEALRGTRTLLVLDNLESLLKSERDTVFTLVKRLPQGCKAILTSRGRIGSGAEELILEKLSEDAALATLAKLAESNPALEKTSEAERLTLYVQTGGNPLLLRWTAGQIGRGSCLTFTDAIFFLRSCPQGNDPLEFVFGDLVDNFSEDETRALCALTYFTLPAKVAHISELARASDADVDRALRSLVNRSLVVPSEELKTFSLVPLVADFLRRKRPEIVAETGDRLEERAYALVVENGYMRHERFPNLDVAWPVVAAALPRFRAGTNDRLQTVCDALDAFLNFTGHWDEQLALSVDAESRAVEVGDLRRASRRAYDAGYVNYLRGQPGETLACGARAEAHCQDAHGGNRLKAVAISLRGHGHRLAEDYVAAVAAYRESLECLRAVDAEAQDVAIALNNLATAEAMSGDLDSAKRDYTEALRLARAAKYDEGIAESLGNLAAVALALKEWTRAKALADEALILAEKVGRLDLIAYSCSRLATALTKSGGRTEAIRHARRAVELYTRLGLPEAAGAREMLAECESAPEAEQG